MHINKNRNNQLYHNNETERTTTCRPEIVKITKAQKQWQSKL